MNKLYNKYAITLFLDFQTTWSTTQTQTTMTQVLPSAAGILSLLDEDEYELKELALTRLESIVNEFWAEISESIRKM